MRARVALLLALFTSLAAGSASAGTYTFSVQVYALTTATPGGNGSYVDLNDTFQLQFTIDSTATTTSSFPFGNPQTNAFNGTLSTTGTPYGASLENSYLAGQQNLQTGGNLNAASYLGSDNNGYGLTYFNYSSAVNASIAHVMSLSWNSNAPLIDLTVAGGFDQFMQGLVGKSFTFSETARNGWDTSSTYYGTAILVDAGSAVPEPNALLVIGAGLLIAAAAHRRKHA